MNIGIKTQSALGGEGFGHLHGSFTVGMTGKCIKSLVDSRPDLWTRELSKRAEGLGREEPEKEVNVATLAMATSSLVPAGRGLRRHK